MDSSESKSVKLLVIGCGSRGECYASYALQYPQRARVVGLAEPRKFSRNKFINLYKHTIEDDKIFNDWYDIIKLPERIADCVIIALPGKN